ncbi:porin [Consotaella aegiceratis]|uniref:porin n=1 Tax=Consotaella aegiceratis TaxID=3097961 RepID=UPI002F407DB1
MNIKSLLLGSAAALVAVSGARAADAVVMVEPEPVDYVRVCDVYGTGFYYIPGTETCLKIGGFVRFQISGTGGDDTENSEGDDYATSWRTRARLNVDAREETEFGQLRAYMALQDDSDSSADFHIDSAYIQLGGLTMGYLDSIYKAGTGTPADQNFKVGAVKDETIQYTFSSNGFVVAIGADDDGTGDVTPDFSAKIGYTGGWGSFFVYGGLDEDTDYGFGDDFLDPTDYETFDAYDTFVLEGSEGDTSGSLKANLTLTDLVAAGSTLTVEGTYSFDPNRYSVWDGGFDLPIEWSASGGYGQELGKLFVAVGGFYGETFDLGYGVGDVDYYGSADVWGAELYGSYELTDNFVVSADIYYSEVDYAGPAESDLTAGYLRFQRNF